MRRARAEDAAELTRITLASKASHGYGAAFMAACREELTITADKLATFETWVASDGGPDAAMLGYFSLESVGVNGEVHAIYVDPGVQNRGVGKYLWSKIEERASTLGMRTLLLDADPFAVPFYEKMGLTVTGEAPSGSIPGRMLPRMEKRLR